MQTFVLVLPVVIGILVYMYLAPHREYLESDGQIHRAWHIQAPGFSEWNEPEDTMDLAHWEVDGAQDPKTKAESVLIIMKFDEIGYEVKQLPGGDWVLQRPEEHKRVFSWRMLRRISPWGLVA